MGKLRPSFGGIVYDKIIHPKDMYCKIRIDVPKFPAKVLLDDIKYNMIKNIGYRYNPNMWSYIIEPYPKSHHI